MKIRIVSQENVVERNPDRQATDRLTRSALFGQFHARRQRDSEDKLVAAKEAKAACHRQRDRRERSCLVTRRHPTSRPTCAMSPHRQERRLDQPLRWHAVTNRLFLSRLSPALQLRHLLPRRASLHEVSPVLPPIRAMSGRSPRSLDRSDTIPFENWSECACRPSCRRARRFGRSQRRVGIA